MPERRRARVLLGLGVIALGVVAAPAVLAQTTEDPAAWEGSNFTDPFENGEARVTGESFPISGLFTKTREPPGEQIVRVDVVFGGGDDESVDTTTPTEPPAEDDPSPVSCIPEDQEFLGGGTVDESGETATYEFTVPEEESVWPCNGRYTITATATTGAGARHDIEAVLTVAVPPKPVTVVAARVLEGNRDVEITWEPLAEEDLAVDASGYRIERAGPGTSEGAFGPFTSLGTVGVDGEPKMTDRPPEGGVFRYRVRALRDGADGPVASPAEGTAFADATVAGEPGAESTTTTRGTSRTGVVPRTPSRRGATPSLTVPTTADPGFENELDYGDREPGSSPELAGDSGRSIIRTDDSGVGLAAPVAGALVLLGWAGHLAYLNRLARQF